ncbi:MAG: 2-oxo acid dehydrogenase subunit E2 [Anaerolineae bacterium]|nr:2-oxo acid dehydrogenase subunit E2 [Anaerolineae bacterium]NUQ06550.1 2-oxo acid dehydrogenase subunit E2 [Anaerolineae bacterium]
MPTNVIMPQLGESVVEGTVSRWLKQPGDRVQAFEPLLEISTDKVDSEIPAPAEGVLLQILVPAGETVERGTILAIITGDGEGAAPTAGSAAASNGASRPAADPPATGDYAGHVTPVVARMAVEHRLDLGQIAGTGRDGRITKKDVERYLEARLAAQTPPAAGIQTEAEAAPWEKPVEGADLFKPTVDYSAEPAPASASPRPAVLAAPSAPAAPPPTADGALIRLSPMRRAIADHMVRSKLHTSPHVTTVFEVDLSAVMAHRQAHKAEFAAQNVHLTLTAYFVAAAVEGLRAVPVLNGQWRDDGIFVHREQHIGMAVALDDGLIVPVIRRAGDLNLLGIARAVGDLAGRARAKALQPDEVQGGTFTITNHGVSGSLFATPIINQPQVGILGVGVVEKRVKVLTDAHGGELIAIRPCVYVSLTFDHRVADGAAGDKFLNVVKNTLENWSLTPAG